MSAADDSGNGFDVKKFGVLRSGVMVSYDVNWPDNILGTGSVPDFGSAGFEGSYIDGNSGSLAKSGYIFLGWSVDSFVFVPDLSVSSLSFMGFANYLPGSWQGFVLAGEDFTVYAVWQSVSFPNYTVVYSGSGSMGGVVPIDSGSPYYSGAFVVVLGNMGNLVKTGFRFLGWNANQCH